MCLKIHFSNEIFINICFLIKIIIFKNDNSLKYHKSYHNYKITQNNRNQIFILNRSAMRVSTDRHTSWFRSTCRIWSINHLIYRSYWSFCSSLLIWRLPHSIFFYCLFLSCCHQSVTKFWFSVNEETRVLPKQWRKLHQIKCK